MLVMSIIVPGRVRRTSAGVLLAALTALAGCHAAPRWAYDRPGVSLATIDQDLSRCRKDSLSGWRRTVDDALVKRCMERLGYTAAPEP